MEYCSICKKEINQKGICAKCNKKRTASNIIIKLSKHINFKNPFSKNTLKKIGISNQYRLDHYFWTLKETNLIKKEKNMNYLWIDMNKITSFVEKYSEDKGASFKINTENISDNPKLENNEITTTSKQLSDNKKQYQENNEKEDKISNNNTRHDNKDEFIDIQNKDIIKNQQNSKNTMIKINEEENTQKINSKNSENNIQSGWIYYSYNNDKNTINLSEYDSINDTMEYIENNKKIHKSQFYKLTKHPSIRWIKNINKYYKNSSTYKKINYVKLLTEDDLNKLFKDIDILPIEITNKNNGKIKESVNNKIVTQRIEEYVYNNLEIYDRLANSNDLTFQEIYDRYKKYIQNEYNEKTDTISFSKYFNKIVETNSLTKKFSQGKVHYNLGLKNDKKLNPEKTLKFITLENKKDILSKRNKKETYKTQTPEAIKKSLQHTSTNKYDIKIPEINIPQYKISKKEQASNINEIPIKILSTSYNNKHIILLKKIINVRNYNSILDLLNNTKEETTNVSIQKLDKEHINILIEFTATEDKKQELVNLINKYNLD